MNCILACFAKIPWWAWIILAILAILIAVLAYFTWGSAVVVLGVTIPLWLTSLITGLGGTFGATLLYCIKECTKRG